MGEIKNQLRTDLTAAMKARDEFAKSLDLWLTREGDFSSTAIVDGGLHVKLAGGNAEVLSLPLVFAGGRMSLGPVPLGPAPQF